MMHALGAVVRRLPDPLLELVFRSFLYRGHELCEDAEEAFDKYWPNCARHGGAEAFIRQVDALDTADTLAVADELLEFDVPARVVWGAADGFQKIEYVERFARDLHAPLHPDSGREAFHAGGSSQSARRRNQAATSGSRPIRLPGTAGVMMKRSDAVACEAVGCVFSLEALRDRFESAGLPGDSLELRRVLG